MAENENIDIRLPTCYNQIKRGGCREQWDLFSFTGLPRPDTPKLNAAFTMARRPMKVCVLFAYLRKKDGGRFSVLTDKDTEPSPVLKLVSSNIDAELNMPYIARYIRDNYE